VHYCCGVARVVLLLITLGTLAACGSSSASPSGTSSSSAAAASARCGPASARTLARGSQVRVYVQKGIVLGCLGGSHRRPVTLGATGSCLRTSRVNAVAVAGRMVAVAITRCGVDTAPAQVRVIRLSDGHQLFSHAAIANPGPESFATVTALVAGANGRVAWIATAQSIATHRVLTEVLSGRGAAARLLDSGASIAVHSLRLSGSTLGWRDGGRRRTAQLA
jgi:hypothetical protein